MDILKESSHIATKDPIQDPSKRNDPKVHPRRDDARRPYIHTLLVMQNNLHEFHIIKEMHITPSKKKEGNP